VVIERFAGKQDRIDNAGHDSGDWAGFDQWTDEGRITGKKGGGGYLGQA